MHEQEWQLQPERVDQALRRFIGELYQMCLEETEERHCLQYAHLSTPPALRACMFGTVSSASLRGVLSQSAVALGDDDDRLRCVSIMEKV